MGVTTSKTESSVLENGPTDLSIAEIRTALFACQLCQLANTDDTDDTSFLFKAANNTLKVDNVIREVKRWSIGSEGEHALTLSVDMMCQQLRLTKRTSPINIEIVVFCGKSNFNEFLIKAAHDSTTNFIIPKNRKLNRRREKNIGDVSKLAYEAYDSVRNHSGLLKYLYDNATKKQNKVLITGHGLGGALAQCLAAELLHFKHPGICNVALITFGSPKVFDLASSAAVTAKAQYYALHFMNKGDPITAVPSTTLRLEHTGLKAIYDPQSTDLWKVYYEGYESSTRALYDNYQNSEEGGEEKRNEDNGFRFHQLDGDGGYFLRIKEYLWRKLPSGSVRDHPKNNPILNSQGDDYNILERSCEGAGKVYDDVILCIDGALGCEARCFGNFDSASCSNMFAKCSKVVCCCGLCIILE